MEISSKFSKLANDLAGVEATYGLNVNNLKRSVYTLDEISALPDETKVYRSVGKCFKVFRIILLTHAFLNRENVLSLKSEFC